MNSKIEKYYNFIVEDIISKIVIDKQTPLSILTLSFPFYNNDVSMVTINDIPTFRDYPPFKDYLIKNYGTRRQDIYPIWDLLFIRLVRLVSDFIY